MPWLMFQKGTDATTTGACRARAGRVKYTVSATSRTPTGSTASQAQGLIRRRRRWPTTSAAGRRDRQAPAVPCATVARAPAPHPWRPQARGMPVVSCPMLRRPGFMVPRTRR